MLGNVAKRSRKQLARRKNAPLPRDLPAKALVVGSSAGACTLKPRGLLDSALVIGFCCIFVVLGFCALLGPETFRYGLTGQYEKL